MTLESTIEAQTNQYHRTLNPVLWNILDLKEDVRNALLVVANDFIASWGFDIPVKDIVLTGSNANYNWTVFSDCDIHVIVNMSGVPKADKGFVTEFLKAKKQLWNEKRKVKIKGYPVEVYAQDTAELLIAKGVFSLQTNEWIKKPNRSIPPKPNMLAVKSKVEDFTNMIDDAIMQGNELSLVDIVRRISEMRKAGLAAKGEFSTENLAFKVLRNDGTIAKLRAAIDEMTDKKLTLESHIRIGGNNAPEPKHQGPHSKEVWYDRKQRMWAGHWKDAGGNQVGEVEHAPHKHIVHKNLDASPPKLEESDHRKSPKYHKGTAKKYHFVNRHKGPKHSEGGLSSSSRWKKRRVAKMWAWKRSRFSKLSREKPGAEKTISHRTYMAARNLTYKAILGKRSKSKLPYGERARVERTAKRVYKLNVKNPENRNRYKYRRRDTTERSGVSYKNP